MVTEQQILALLIVSLFHRISDYCLAIADILEDLMTCFKYSMQLLSLLIEAEIPIRELVEYRCPTTPETRWTVSWSLIGNVYGRRKEVLLWSDSHVCISLKQLLRNVHWSICKHILHNQIELRAWTKTPYSTHDQVLLSMHACVQTFAIYQRMIEPK